MLKIPRIAVLVLLLLLAVMPTLAQDDTLPDTAAADPQLSILTQALETTGLDAALVTGEYTLFAPTDEAFTDALALLGLSAEELLADTELLTEILLYHVLSGTYTSETIIAALDPEANVYLETLQGEEVLLSVDGERIFLNADPLLNEPASGAEVITPDVLATNGVIHVINAVLLPPLEETDATAFVRLAHFAPDVPSIEVYIDGILSDVGVLAYTDMTGWIEFPAGMYALDFVPEGGSIEDAVIPSVIVTLPENAWVTLPITGSLEAESLVVQDIIGDYVGAIPEGLARVTFFHGIAEAPPVDFAIDDTLIFEDVAYLEVLDTNAAFTVDVPAATHTLSVIIPGDAPQVIWEFVDFELQPDTFYFIAAIGTPGTPEMVIQTIPVTAIQEILNEAAADVPQADLSEATPEMTPEPEIQAPLEPVATITVDALFDDTDEFYGEVIALEGDYSGHIDFGSFILSDRDLIDLDPEYLLVLDVSDGGLNFIPYTGTAVRVVGTLELLVIADIVRDYNLILDDDLYLQFEEAPVLLAQSVENLELVEPINVDEVVERPVAYLNKTVTVVGDVGMRFGDEGFLLYDQDLIDFDQEVILVLYTAQPATNTELSEGQSVSVTGDVRPFSLADIEVEYGIDLDDVLYREYEGVLVMVAGVVVPAQ